MKSRITDSILFIIGVLLIVLATKTWVNKAWELEAIQQGNGYYHPQTGIFTWNSEG